MAPLAIDLSVRTLSALAVGAGGSANARVDRSIVRDAWGRPIIPGSQLKGRLRHAVEQLLAAMGEPVPRHFDDESASAVRAIFGSPGHPSPLRFHDLPCTITPAEPYGVEARALRQVRPAVALSRRRRTAEDNLLMVQELAADGLVFAAESAVVGHLDDERHVALLWAAARLVDRWGGGKSRGLGWAEVTAAISWGGEPFDEARAAAALRGVKGGS